MSNSAGPKITKDGLVLDFDAANLKSYPPNQDPYVNQTVLMLNGENIIDYSLNQTAITNNGAVTVSSVQYKVGQSSLSFTGASNTSYLHATTTSAIVFGTGDFTIEFWIYFNSVANTNIVDQRDTTGNQLAISLYLVSTLRYFTNGADRITGPVLATGTWYHIAISRVSSSTRMFVNGSQVGSTYADTNNYVGPNFSIGGYRVVPTANLNGYIDEFRVTKGGRYSSNFTPQTRPFYLPNILIDLTKNKTVGTLINSPTYSSANGGSIVFDGVNDYVNIPASTNLTFGTGDFTMEVWFKTRAKTTLSPTLLGVNLPWAANVWNLIDRHVNNSTKLTFWSYNYNTSAAMLISNTSISNAIWYQVVITRISNTWSMYINGSLESSVTSSISLDSGVSNSINLGVESVTDPAWYDGNISMTRIHKGKGLTSTQVYNNFVANRGRFGV